MTACTPPMVDRTTDPDRVESRSVRVAVTDFTATRVVVDSVHPFAVTRDRFEEQVPLLGPADVLALTVEDASWQEVADALSARLGPSGLVALARVDQGALFSLGGDAIEATLYLVGNPVAARDITQLSPASALYAPLRVAVFTDLTGVHVAYDLPSAVLASLGSTSIDDVAVEVDRQMARVALDACGAPSVPQATPSPSRPPADPATNRPRT